MMQPGTRVKIIKQPSGIRLSTPYGTIREADSTGRWSVVDLDWPAFNRKEGIFETALLMLGPKSVEVVE